MSIELPSLETTNPPRVESTRWRKFGPYLVLISVITLVVAFSTPTPEPVVEIPIPRPPALDESDAQKLRGGFWNVEEMWLGAKLEFSEQAEIKCLSLATDRLERGEPPITARFSYRLARLTPHNTLEISSQQHESTNRVRTSKRLMT